MHILSREILENLFVTYTTLAHFLGERWYVKLLLVSKFLLLFGIAILTLNLTYLFKYYIICILNVLIKKNVFTEAAASCNPSRPKVTPETTKENCYICGKTENFHDRIYKNVQKVFS